MHESTRPDRVTIRPGGVVALGLGVLAAIGLGLPGAARAQMPPAPPPPPDVAFGVVSLLGVDDPASQAPPYVGSLFWAIDQANAAVASPTVGSAGLVVGADLIDLSIVLQDELPAIDLPASVSTPDPRVELNATAAPAFILTTAADVPANFVLLRIRNGRADLVNLNIISGRMDANGNRVALNVVVEQDAVLGFRYAADTVFDQNITGDGGVRIESNGVVAFTGTNDYLGGTHVVSGTLRGNDASLNGDFTLDAGTQLDFLVPTLGVTEFFVDDIDGAGRLRKSGLGTLFLDGGTATHTGGTEIAGGTLRATPDSLGGDVSVGRGTTLWLEQDGATPFIGAISGMGGVRKTGSTALVLSGVNTFAGGLVVDEGDVVVTTASLPGNASLTSALGASNLIFDQDVGGTHTGTVSGSGVLRKLGTGRVLRQGVTSVDQVQIREGTLAGDVASLGSNIDVGDLAGNGVVEFAINDVQTFGGILTGFGQVSKTGVGTLVLASDAMHLGDTVVAGGTLQLNGDIVGNGSASVRVDPGARLSTTGGGLVNVDLDVQGVVATGSPSTTLNVGGDANLMSGSVVQTSLDAAGNASLLSVGGIATLAAPSYELDISPGDYSVAQTYTVISSANPFGAGSTAGQAIDDLAFIEVVAGPTLNANTVTLDVQEDFSDIAAFGITSNQKTTALALQQVTSSGTADSRTIRNGLVPLRVGQVPAVLDTIAPETLSGFFNPRIANARHLADAVSRRLRARSWELERPPTEAAQAIRPVSSGPSRTRGGPGAWIEGFGLFGDLDGRLNASDMSTNTYGAVGGFDYRLPEDLPFAHSEHYRVGIAAGYTRFDVRNDTAFMHGTANGFQTALYGGYRGRRFHAGGSARFAWTSMETDRHILFTSVDRNAYGRTEGIEWGGVLEAGGHFGDRRRILFHPLARFQYVHSTQDAFTETGAGDLSVSVPELTVDSLLLTVGARVSRVFTLGGEFGIEPELRGAWTVDYGDRGRHVPATFYAVPGATPFVTAGAEPDRNSAVVGIGYVMMIGDVPLLSTHYDVGFGENHLEQVLSVGLYIRW